MQLQANLNEDQIRSIFKAMDTDRKGKINFEQFCMLVQKRKINMDSIRQSPTPKNPAGDTRTVISIQQSTMSSRSRSVNRSILRKGDNETDVMSSVSKVKPAAQKKFDINQLYDQIENAQPSIRVKRKLKILTNTQQVLSPQKLLPSISEARETHAYGKPVARSDVIKDVMQYEHLNDLLRQKLRDQFSVGAHTPINKNVAIVASHSSNYASQSKQQNA